MLLVSLPVLADESKNDILARLKKRYPRLIEGKINTPVGEVWDGMVLPVLP